MLRTATTTRRPNGAASWRHRRRSVRALIARAGLILGPYEIVGRMPWWLRRIERGGDVLAPGPPDQPLQYVDCRDLAEWMLRAADDGVGGIFNTVSRPGHATMASLLGAAKAAT